jgi:PEP-CTERM motif
MYGKHLIYGISACLLLATSVVEVQGNQIKKVSPSQSGFTIMPITQPEGNTQSVPDNQSTGGGSGPSLSANAPVSVSAVPEPATIAMMFFGFGCLGALLALRRRRHG